MSTVQPRQGEKKKKNERFAKSTPSLRYLQSSKVIPVGFADLPSGAAKAKAKLAENLWIAAAENDIVKLRELKAVVMNDTAGHHTNEKSASASDAEVEAGWSDTVASTVQYILDCGVDGRPSVGLEGSMDLINHYPPSNYESVDKCIEVGYAFHFRILVILCWAEDSEQPSVRICDSCYAGMCIFSMTQCSR